MAHTRKMPADMIAVCTDCERIWNEARREWRVEDFALSIAKKAHAAGVIRLTHSYCPACLDVHYREDYASVEVA